MAQQQKWHRRESKRDSRKKFKSDNRNSIRGILNIIRDKAEKIREEKMF